VDNENKHLRPELDMQDVMRNRFEAGEGVVILSANMPDPALLLSIKQAASFGKPFTVIPAASVVYVGPRDGDADLFSKGALAASTTTAGHFFADAVSLPGRSLLESLSANQQQALHDWAQKKTPINGCIDMMAWPGWAEQSSRS
jgi:hypothetical protein